MKIYKLDGTFIDNHFDTDFGWNCSDIIIDEAVPDFQARNRDHFLLTQTKHHKYQITKKHDEDDDEEVIVHDKNVCKNVKKHEPKIKMCGIKNILECKMNVEGWNNCMDDKISINLNTPPKYKLTNLIYPFNYKAKLLLSIISSSEYKNSQYKPYTDIYRVVNLRTTNYKHLFNYATRNEFDDYSFLHKHNENSASLSLMMEFILTDNYNFNCKYGKSPAIDCVDGEKLNANGVDHYLQVKNNYAIQDYVDRSLAYVCKETYEIRMLIEGIRRSFQIEENRINELIQNARQLEIDLKETLYLDIILNLLNETVLNEIVKMAKKGQVQLQAEINNDEEWEALLEKSGLIVVDIYSDWCGPCMGMAANLKKLKLEIGGDLLQLAVAKSDTISSLARFRNKSEPTWMFISKGKMVNLMFGADAPKLTRLIINELKREKSELPRDRPILEITELAEEEQVRYEEAEAIAKAAVEKEEAKKRKEIYDRRTAECSNIVENLKSYGVVLVFPHAKDVYKDVLQEVVGEAGLTIQQIERINLDEKMLEELLFFSETDETIFTETEIEELITEQSIALLLKPSVRGEVFENMDEVVLKMLYGPSMIPPGNDGSPAWILYYMEKDVDVKYETTALWAPPNSFVRAASLKLFYPKLTLNYIIPEPKPEPPYYVMVFNDHQKQQVFNIIEKYPNEIKRYGFFSSENPEEAQLIAKTLKKLELSPLRTFNEKFVIQVAKRKSECQLALVHLSPIYMSANVEEGKKECERFFPEDYDEVSEEDENEEAVEIRLSANEEKDEDVEEPNKIENEETTEPIKLDDPDDARKENQSEMKEAEPNNKS